MVNPSSNKEFAITEDLILVNEQVKNNEEIIQKLGELLFKNGYVKDTYTQAVIDREITYPTGLQARAAGVAVPHTDTNHVINPAVAIATLENPVVFHGMGAPDTEIMINIVLMLAIHDPKEVVNVLRKIIFIVEDDEALNRILKATTKEEIKEIMKDHIAALTKKLGK